MISNKNILSTNKRFNVVRCATVFNIVGIALLTMIGLVSLSGCGSKGNDNPQPVIESGPGPAEFKSDFRTSSLFVTKMASMRRGTSPHGVSQIWYSKNIESLLDKTSFKVPEGTVSIKPYNMTGGPGIDGYAVMVKKPAGYDPEHNDWYYENRDPDGKITAMPAPGKIAMCISCHSGGAATDYLMGTKLR